MSTPVGEGHHRAKYSDAVVAEAIRLRTVDGLPVREIAARLGVPFGTVNGWFYECKRMPIVGQSLAARTAKRRAWKAKQNGGYG